MRKRFLAGVLSVVLAGSMLTGCMKVKSDVNISENGACSVSGYVRVEKEAMLGIVKKVMSGFSDIVFGDEIIIAYLEKQGMKAVTDEESGREYFELSSSSGTVANYLGNGIFDSITDYYKYLVSNAGYTVLSEKQNEFIGFSETSAVIHMPGNLISDILGNSITGGDTKGMSAPDGIPADNKILDMLKNDKTILESFKSAEVVINVKFATEISKSSENVILSADKKTATFKFPLASEQNIEEYAYCVNDIAAEGAENGRAYSNGVTVKLPEGVTAVVNGGNTAEGSIECNESGIYNIKMTALDGTKETLCFAVDNTVPQFKLHKKDKASSKGFDEEIKNGALLNGKNSNTIISYDVYGDISYLSLDGKDITESTSSYALNGEDILGGIYYVHEYFLSDLKEGVHQFKAVDRFGQESKLKLTIDNTKPSVTGVKNNKTYKKDVTIKFSDKNGIASAKLNGKKISSGTKVSKNKSYVLKVTDKAGNVNTIKFKINRGKTAQK